MEPSERNLDPVEKITAPKNRSEVGSVREVFNQFRYFFNRYDRLAVHMTRLLRKHVSFEWTDEHEKSFQYIRSQLLPEVDRKRKALHRKRAPPYYKETAAWMNGMKRIRIYADSSV